MHPSKTPPHTQNKLRQALLSVLFFPPWGLASSDAGRATWLAFVVAKQRLLRGPAACGADVGACFDLLLATADLMAQQAPREMLRPTELLHLAVPSAADSASSDGMQAGVASGGAAVAGSPAAPVSGSAPVVADGRVLAQAGPRSLPGAGAAGSDSGHSGGHEHQWREQQPDFDCLAWLASVYRVEASRPRAMQAQLHRLLAKLLQPPQQQQRPSSAAPGLIPGLAADGGVPPAVLEALSRAYVCTGEVDERLLWGPPGPASASSASPGDFSSAGAGSHGVTAGSSERQQRLATPMSSAGDAQQCSQPQQQAVLTPLTSARSHVQRQPPQGARVDALGWLRGVTAGKPDEVRVRRHARQLLPAARRLLLLPAPSVRHVA